MTIQSKDINESSYLQLRKSFLRVLDQNGTSHSMLALGTMYDKGRNRLQKSAEDDANSSVYLTLKTTAL